METFFYSWPDGGKFVEHDGEWDWSKKTGLLELTNVKSDVPEDSGNGKLRVDMKSVNTGASASAAQYPGEPKWFDLGNYTDTYEFTLTEENKNIIIWCTITDAFDETQVTPFITFQTNSASNAPNMEAIDGDVNGDGILDISYYFFFIPASKSYKIILPFSHSHRTITAQ